MEKLLHILYNNTVLVSWRNLVQHPHPIPSPRQFPDPQHFRDLERLGDEITELAAHIHAATFQLLELIRVFDEEHGWAGEGVNSCAHWLNWKCGMNMGAARIALDERW
jgi:hypothetical protein